MVDQVAKALCDAAGRSVHHDPDVQNAGCSCCERLLNGRIVCVYWETFRGEARAAIAAAYQWHRKERRWPSFCK